MFPLVLLLISSCHATLDDVTYKLTWTSLDNLPTDPSTGEEVLLMKTPLGEEYACVLPSTVVHSDEADSFSNSTLSGNELIQKLTFVKPCITQADSYWSYEVCHNNYVRQFHDTPGDETNTVQEYYLGRHSDTSSSISNSNEPDSILLLGSEFPYFPVEFSDGTPCDLTGEPRTCRLVYVCMENEIGRLVQVSEVRTCHYDLIFATKFLCENALYKVSKLPSTEVSCVAQNSAPVKPTALKEFEEEKRKLNKYGLAQLTSFLEGMGLKDLQVETETKDDMVIYRIRSRQDTTKPEEGESESRGVDGQSDYTEPEDDDDDDDNNSASSQSRSSNAHPTSTGSVQSAPDPSMGNSQFYAFLRGEYCVPGYPSGWWSYEVCFKQNVTQFHNDEHGDRVQNVLLGRWDRALHDQWVVSRSSSKPTADQSSSKRIDLFYGDGEFCEESNAKRFAVVKLRCDRFARTIQLSFSESKCTYSVLIESVVICDMPDDEINQLVL